jgi:hypothetical protein
MPNYRPSKSFLRCVSVGAPLLAALYFGLVPEIASFSDPAIPGQLRFPADRPDVHAAVAGSTPRDLKTRSLDWLLERVEELEKWEHNPWKSDRQAFGSHYLRMLDSDDPRDRARAKELQRLGEALWRKALERYPELAVAERSVPPDRNGFLKWLDFAARVGADPSRPGTPADRDLGMPEALKRHLGGDSPWDETAARAWVKKERAMVDEIRAIGLLPDRSTGGIEPDRYGFIPARLAKQAGDILLLDARLAAGDGDLDRAMESVRAAQGLAAHFSQVESPSLLAATVALMLNLQTQEYVVTQVIPALPMERREVAAWERALEPSVQGPAEFGRLMRGEWNVMARSFLMPMLADAQDPRYPPDPAALVDAQAGGFVRMVAAASDPAPAAWATLSLPPMLSDTSHLSRRSEELVEMLFVGAEAWSRGLELAQHRTGMVQAALAIHAGQPLPRDPVHGQAYRWDEATRTLSPPDGPPFAGLSLEPLVVPR